MSPAAGEAIAVLCTVVIRGINNPDVVDLMSSIALGSGADPSVLIATLPWAKVN
jgi:hypothetical protein